MTCVTLTEIIVVLDRSGSMESIREATIEAFNGYVQSQMQSEGEVRLSLVQFDHEYEEISTNQPISHFQPLSNTTYVPRGSTALYDAVGRTIMQTGQRYAQQPEENRPGCVIFVIQTDGFENASRVYSSKQIHDMISEQTSRYAWQFVFLGANQDAIASAGQVGISPQSALSYDADKACTKAAFEALAQCTSEYRRGRARSPHTAGNWQFSSEARENAKRN